jgi:hypothetical protein
MKGINKLAYKLLVKDTSKFTALLMGITFAVFLMVFVTSMFSGVMKRATSTVINVGAPLWVMDSYVETVQNSVGMPACVLDAVRSMHGVKYAVPLYSGAALIKLADGNYQAVTVIGLDDTSLYGRPGLIAAAERSVAQANAQIGVAKTAYFPTILLSATGGFGNSSASSWFTWPSRFWSVGPSLAETIFDAGLRRATMQQYRASYEATVANYRQTVLTAFQQVEDNLASLRILSQDIEQQDVAVEAAARSLQEATVRYKAGLDPYLNVISAQTILLNDQQTAVNFRMQQMVASVQLIKALGGGWGSAQLPSPNRLKTSGGY